MLHQHALTDDKARAVGGGIPAAISLELEKESLFLQVLHQRIVRTIGIGHISNGHRIPLAHILLHQISKVISALPGTAIIAAGIGLICPAIGIGVHRQHQVCLFGGADLHASPHIDSRVDGSPRGLI